MATLDDRGVRLACAACGTVNRIRYEVLHHQTRCAKCRASLESPPAPIAADDQPSAEAALARASLPVVVDFWAPWCGPCKVMAPELDKAARTLGGAALVMKVNVDDLPRLAERYGVQSIPTIVVSRAGKEVRRASGARPASEIEVLVSGTRT